MKARRLSYRLSNLVVWEPQKFSIIQKNNSSKPFHLRTDPLYNITNLLWSLQLEQYHSSPSRSCSSSVNNLRHWLISIPLSAPLVSASSASSVGLGVLIIFSDSQIVETYSLISKIALLEIQTINLPNWLLIDIHQ